METTETGLTKNQVQALRTADSIVFRRVLLSKENNSAIDRIELIKKGQDGPWTTEQRIVIDMLPGFEIKRYRAFAHIGSAQFDNIWATISGLIKEGDILQLHWAADYHTNNLMEERGLHGDVLQLIVKRKNKRFTFVIDSTTTLDNSARMIQKEEMIWATA